MRYFKPAFALLSALALPLLSVVLAAPAHAVPVPSGTEYCAVLISNQLDRDGSSKVLHRSCSSISAEEARRELDATTTLSSTQLMNWYEHADFGGSVTVIYGDSGGCDGAGYRVQPNSYWKTHLSSIKGFNQCNRIRLYNIALSQSAAYYLPLSNLGYYNDNVGLTQVYHF